MWETGKGKKEKVILVTVDVKAQDSRWLAQDSSKELAELARSSGTEVVKEIICRRHKPTPTYFIGKGKAEELFYLTQSLNADAVIFNEDLSSTHQRNLEEIIKTKTVDRTQLILDIFAQRAKSMEGKIQVELAQLEYLLPRLTGQGIILSRLGGGIGTRGPGEKKLEVDRRRIKERIAILKKELRNLSQRRGSLREYRRRHALPTIAIIGYTNAGKTTLLNSLTGAQQTARDSLFSTLDSVARRFILPNNQKVLFSDTVGFLQRLPHHLIEAFKATLEEVKEANLLLHVLDISHPNVYEQNEAVYKVLTELQADDKPMVIALNKLDLVDNSFSLKRYLKDFENSVAVSALKKINIEQLLERLSLQLANLMTEVAVCIPQNQHHLLNLIYRTGNVLSKQYLNEQIYVRACVSQRTKAMLKEFLQPNP